VLVLLGRGLGQLRDDVAAIHDVYADAGKPIIEVRVADRAGAHVDPPTGGAEIERRADDRDPLGRPHVFFERSFGGSLSESTVVAPSTATITSNESQIGTSTSTASSSIFVPTKASTIASP
jgi:hypothetical protein